MILMNMQTNNMEELTGYAKQIKKEQDEFYEKHAEIIKNLRQKELKRYFRYYFTRYERNRRRYFDSIARAESPGIGRMFRDLEIDGKKK